MMSKHVREMAEFNKAVSPVAEVISGLENTRKDLFGGAASIGMQAFNEDSAMGKPN